MHVLALTISVCAGIVQILGYVIYNREMFLGRIKPNATSWFMWGMGSALATWSYVALSQDWVKDILPVTCAIVCILTFVFALLQGNYQRPDMYDVFVCVLDMGILGFWFLTDSDEYTNLLFQIDAILSFVPIIKGTWKNPSNERATPWIMWSIAYSLMGVVVLMRFEKWWDLMYPVNYFVLHLTIVFIVLLRRKR